jgi:hypothetical protein
MAKKLYSIYDILSLSTGRLLSPRRTDAFSDIVGHILNADIGGTAGLIESTPVARQYLEQELPWVKQVKFPELSDDLTMSEREGAILVFIEEAISKYGAYHQVGQISDGRGNAAPKAVVRKDGPAGPELKP